MPSPETTQQCRINFPNFRHLGLPLGRMIDDRVESSRDPETKAGLSAVSELLQDRGAVILDAHLTSADTIATGVRLVHELPLQNIVAPVSAFDYYWILTRGFFRGLNTMPGVDLRPIYREEDKRFIHRKWFYYSVSDSVRRFAISEFRKQAELIVQQPFGAAIIAAYNGVGKMGESLSPIATRLLLHGAPALCTLSVFNSKRHCFQLFCSEKLIQFDPEILRTSGDKELVQERIAQEHRALHFRSREKFSK